MRHLSSTLLLLALVEEVIFFGVIWNHPAAAWHTSFVVGILLTAAALLYIWVIEHRQAKAGRLGHLVLLLLVLVMSAGIVCVLASLALFH